MSQPASRALTPRRRPEADPGPTAVGIADLDRAAMGPDDAGDDRQPQSGARLRPVLLSPVEAVEDPGPILSGDPRAVVADPHAAVLHVDLDGAVGGAVLVGVAQQVGNRPL